MHFHNQTFKIINLQMNNQTIIEDNINFEKRFPKTSEALSKFDSLIDAKKYTDKYTSKQIDFNQANESINKDELEVIFPIF